MKIPLFSVKAYEMISAIDVRPFTIVMRLLFPLVVLFFPSIRGLEAQTTTATGSVEGYSSVSLVPGGSALVPVFVNPSAYSASTTVSGQSFTATGLTPGAFNTVSGNATYFVEITSGAYTGYYYDVLSNSATSITVAGLPGALTGQSVNIMVRPHTTLGSIANNSAGFASLQDAFTQYQSNNQVASYYYNSGGVVEGDFATPANGVTVPPGTGILVNNIGSATVTFIGEVDTNQYVVSMNAGTTLVGPLDPQGGNSLTNMNLAPALASYGTDSGSLLASDGSLNITSFYSDGTTLLDGNFQPFTSSNAPVVSLGNGFFINASASEYWTNLSVLSN